MKWMRWLAAGLLLLTTARAGTLPDFSLPDIKGAQFHTREHVGKEVMVISFWATWCAPCKQLLTRLDRIKKEHPDIRVIAISIDDTSTVVGVRPYIAGKKFDFTVLLDSDGKVIQMFDPEKKVPFTLVVNRAGSIAYSRTGYLPGDEKEIQKIIEDLSR